METKTCTKCNETKPIDDFYENKKYKNNRTSYCKSCLTAFSREYHRNNSNPKLPRKGLVYCLECEGFYKFGITRSEMKRRMKAMRTGNPFRINIVWEATSNDAAKYERIIHNQLKDNHVRGEWYNIPQVLAKELKHIVRHDEES